MPTVAAASDASLSLSLSLLFADLAYTARERAALNRAEAIASY